MKFYEQHEAFKKLAVVDGISKLEHLTQALPFGCTVPTEQLSKWMSRLLAVPQEFSNQRRYINRFKLGADPEFIFTRDGERADARLLGLAQGLAFGMDNNGRLAELRSHPSRSAVEVVASMWLALRWMSILVPKTKEFEWHCGAFLIGDCLGGHVHFGRKRPQRSLEVKALDAIDDEMLALKAYPMGEVLRRRQGDGRNHPYGLPGDIRLQAHGYEYRTFPSWLDSPELAFLTLVLSKLVVHNPSLAQGYIPLASVDRHYQRVKNLLSYYKDVDDDARLALLMITRKLPVHLGGDFRDRWGIRPCIVATPKIDFIPATVKPTVDDIVAMFNYLRGQGSLLRITPPEPTWSPLVPPDGYKMLINCVNTHGAKGLGELVWDVCTHKELEFNFVNCKDCGGDIIFSLPKSMGNHLPLAWRKSIRDKISFHDGDKRSIYTYENKRQGAYASEARSLLLETVLPFWKISEVKPDSYLQWKSSLQPQHIHKEYVGKVLYGDPEALPIVKR